jgi:hypothetical protein
MWQPKDCWPYQPASCRAAAESGAPFYSADNTSGDHIGGNQAGIGTEAVDTASPTGAAVEAPFEGVAEAATVEAHIPERIGL